MRFPDASVPVKRPCLRAGMVCGVCVLCSRNCPQWWGWGWWSKALGVVLAISGRSGGDGMVGYSGCIVATVYGIDR